MKEFCMLVAMTIFLGMIFTGTFFPAVNDLVDVLQYVISGEEIPADFNAKFIKP